MRLSLFLKRAPRRASRIWCAAALTGLALVTLAAPGGGTAQAETAPPHPFRQFPGLWVGEGRLGYKDGKMETVSCRATYFKGETADQLKQNIRCASASGKIELKSEISLADGRLSGKWVEQMFNLAGDLSGEVTSKGLRVVVKGQDLDANMDIIVRETKQVVEIQFHNTSLVGMTLVLSRSSSSGGGES